MKKFLCLIVLALCSMALSFSDSAKYRSDLVTESSLNICSGIIGANILGKSTLASTEWFYTGRLPKTEAIRKIREALVKNNPKISAGELERQAQEIFREITSMSGQERIARGLMNHVPSLTKTEAMKSAEQSFFSLLSDELLDEAGEEAAEKLRDKFQELMHSRDPDAISAHNKLAAKEAMQTGTPSKSINQETLKAIAQSEAQRNNSLKQKILSNMKKAAPYALFGAGKALSENWEIINDAYDKKVSWSKALSLTGTDFAGYTVTPMLIDGAFTYAGEKAALFINMKEAGLGYTLGVLAWEAGRESLAYMLGEIPEGELYSKLRQSTGKAAASLPANIIAYIVSAGSSTWVVPVIIMAGPFVIQRTYSWYNEKLRERQWLNTVYLDDVRAILGDELINAFTIIQPETRSSIGNPETRPSLANPLTRPSIARP